MTLSLNTKRVACSCQNFDTQIDRARIWRLCASTLVFVNTSLDAGRDQLIACWLKCRRRDKKSTYHIFAEGRPRRLSRESPIKTPFRSPRAARRRNNNARVQRETFVAGELQMERQVEGWNFY